MSAHSADLVERLRHFNRERDPQLIQLKYKAMRADPFAFLRGTCHLFYEDWPSDSDLNSAPPVWTYGDLHLENFGTYKADNRLTYFDVNDFDEAMLAPCTWDLARFLTSVYVSALVLKIRKPDATKLCNTFLDNYIAALGSGHVRMIERENARGLVRQLLRALEQRNRKLF